MRVRRVKRWQASAGRASVVAIAAVAMLAGCGTTDLAAQSSDRAPAGTRTSATPNDLGPPGGSPALARRVARRLLAELILPAGSRSVGPRHGPWQLQTFASPRLVDVHTFFWLPLSMTAAQHFLLAHVPAGTSMSGYGTGGSPAGVAEQCVSYSLNRLPAGLDSENELLVSIAADPAGGTRARVDAQVSWYPSRSAAEYLRPAAFQAVRITAALGGQRRTFTSRAAIARLARLLNSLHALDEDPPSCPEHIASFTLTFTSARHRPVVVTPYGCGGDYVTVRGKAQPGLADIDSNKLLAVIDSLLGARGSSR